MNDSATPPTWSETFLPAPGVSSLVWYNGGLVDWVGGGAAYLLDGTTIDDRVGFAYRFDAACCSPSGEFAVLYERLGTKGLIIRGSDVVREINRSFYQADMFEYPVCLVSIPGGGEAIVHCPDEYNRLEIEDLASGRRLTDAQGRNPEDFFHSRLSISPSGTTIMSAGWVWHPFDTAKTFDLMASLTDPHLLDQSNELIEAGDEVSCAVFQTDDRIIACNCSDAGDAARDADDDEPFQTGSLGVWSRNKKRWESAVTAVDPPGEMMPVGDRYVVGFFGHPKLFDLRTGEVLHAWTSLETGCRASSIIHHLDELPPVALDASGHRFAVADKEGIHVVSFKNG